MIADAEGEAARFSALLLEYQKAPRVTRDRLYIEAVEEVYSNSNKVILDSEGSGNLLYLPIDRLIGSGDRQTSLLNPDRGTTTPSTETIPTDNDAEQDRRTRRIRQ